MTLPQTTAESKPHVSVILTQDGYRWRRYIGPGTAYVSDNVFPAEDAAAGEAQVIAFCYGVPFISPQTMRDELDLQLAEYFERTAEHRRLTHQAIAHYITAYQPSDYTTQILPDYQRDDYVGS